MRLQDIIEKVTLFSWTPKGSAIIGVMEILAGAAIFFYLTH